MQSIPQIRGNLSDEVARQVRERILAGDLAPGARINEVWLAQQLGVSRTPLREALTLLIGEGFVDNVPRRGFFVRGLSIREAEDLYPIRAYLDPQALRLAGIPPTSDLRELTQLNAAIGKASDTTETIELDDAWHRRLLAGCPNAVLLELIEQVIVRTRRYEHAYLRERRHVATATDEHTRILDALQRGDLDAACAALEQNMRSARQPLLEWLRQR